MTYVYVVGSIYGGTRVIIDGDGFILNDTRVFILGTNFTYIGSTSYSQITFTTPSQLTYQNYNFTVSVYVGTIPSLCFLSSCYFSWSTSVTPYFDSVSPSSVRGSTNLTITGRNLLVGGRSASGAHVSINRNICNVTELTNESIICTVKGVEAGQHHIIGSIDGVLLKFT